MAAKKESFGGKQAPAFGKGKDEAPRKGTKTSTAKDTAKTREAKASKGGHREREVK